jgi:precorrin-6A/cobalt-precorrin-6A reductase
MSGSRAMTVLILGGTGEAHALAAALQAAGAPVVSSLAGRVPAPRLPPGEVRIGRFGGAAGLAAWLAEHAVSAVVDATHPFAAQISAVAEAACAERAVPLLRLERPPWREEPGDRWHRVDDLPGAAAAVAGLGRRVLLTTGREGLAAFADPGDLWFLIRTITPPAPPLPPRHELLLARGPFTEAGELALLDRHGIDVLVTKDSGGTSGRAKLAAARARGLPVVVVRRPPPGAAPAVETVAEACAWALQRSAR